MSRQGPPRPRARAAENSHFLRSSRFFKAPPPGAPPGPVHASRVSQTNRANSRRKPQTLRKASSPQGIQGGGLTTDTRFLAAKPQKSLVSFLRIPPWHGALPALSLCWRRHGKRDDAKGLAKLRAVGAAARLSTRPYICLERCDLGVAYGEGLLHTGARYVFLPHPELVAIKVLLEGPVASQRI